MKDHQMFLRQARDGAGPAFALDPSLAEFYDALYGRMLEDCERYRRWERLADLLPADPGPAALAVRFPDGEAKLFVARGLEEMARLMESRHAGLNVRPFADIVREDAPMAGLAAAALAESDGAALGEIAARSRVGFEELVFLLTGWLKPLFTALREGRGFEAALDESSDVRRCPFCGAHPDVAVIMTGKNGRRFLHCALCELLWPYKRIACAVCGSENAGDLEYLAEGPESRYRVDFCRRCNGYIKTVRLGKFEEYDECDPVVENLLTAGMDGAALGRGYRRP